MKIKIKNNYNVSVAGIDGIHEKRKLGYAHIVKVLIGTQKGKRKMPRIDLTGQVFGRLTVIAYVG